MAFAGPMAAVALGVSLLVPGFAFADYETHPELHPEERCAMIPPGIGDPEDPGGAESLHCQRLFWDLPAVTSVGTRVVAAPFDEDRIPRFPNGLTDRIPALYRDDAGNGYELPGPGRTPLCDDPDEVPWWKPLYDDDDQPLIGTDTFSYHSVDAPAEPQTGHLHELACRRGSRVSYGPWQVGTRPSAYDALSRGDVRFENTARLDRDVAAGRTTPDQRIEWNTGSEFYNHFSSHHGVCYNPSHACNDPKNPKPREAYDSSDPEAECRAFQRSADGPDDPEGKGGCYAGDADTRCSGSVNNGTAFRNATQLPGRLSLQFPGGRGMLGVEDQKWQCDHHVVHQLPPGSYSMTRLADFRLQEGGLVNEADVPRHDAEPGEMIGGSAGEMIIQYFTEPATADVQPINFMFNVAPDLATAYPPFTWNYHETHWVPPYDAAITHMSIHSHHRMVKGTMNIVPNPVRAQSPDPNCGGSAGATEPPLHLYTNWDWEDSRICEYWKDPDGPVIIRKGQVLRTTCFVNNGITPEAIKHGLVGGATVEGLRAAGAPIPPDPSTMPTSDWSDSLVHSPLGQELLYGTHPPLNYRVVYKCGSAAGVSSPTGAICDQNPAVDADGDYVDGPYVNDAQCGGGWCNPATIMFANRGEDEMCIGVALYYALPRLGSEDSHDEAMENLAEGDLDGVGTPGATRNVDVVGICHDCPAAVGR